MPLLTTPAFVRSKICNEIKLSVATTRDERQAAFELIYRSYARAGLCGQRECGMRAAPYQLLPTTDIIIADLRGQLISTASLVRDGELGLPMESIFCDEVAARRAAGFRLAEISCLADRRQRTARFFGLFTELSRLMVQLAMNMHVDELVVVADSRHAPLYKRYMAFEQIGDEHTVETARSLCAVPLGLNFANAQIDKPKCWRDFYGEQLPEEVLHACPITETDREYFSLVLDQVGDQNDCDANSDFCYGNSESVEPEDHLLLIR